MQYVRQVQGLLVVAASLCVLACSTAPLSVKRLEPRDAYLALSRTALSGDEISEVSRIVLRRRDLIALYDTDPAAALAALHEVYVSGAAYVLDLFALAEISLAHARKTGSRAHYLAAAMYAYAQLDPSRSAPLLSPVDPRRRLNTDIYNWAIAGALASEDGETVVLEGGTRALPFGQIDISFDRSQLSWNGRELGDFLPASHFEVEGLQNRYWRPGVGTPLAARAHVRQDEAHANAFFIPDIRVPVTAVLRFEDIEAQLRSGKAYAHLELYANTDTETVDIAGNTLPLEAEPSVALAQTVIELNPWQNEIAAFVGKVLRRPNEGRLGGLAPARLDKIPLVFVHGTASSNARWIDMLNDIEADAEIRRAYQFWFFSYDSGNPILYSAMSLRRALRNLVDEVEPDGAGPCIGSMVVIGHSQGGLLVKLVSVDSGTRFWDSVSDVPFDDVRMRDETRELLREAIFFEALPFVERVIFVATPHRGSFRARGGFVRRLARRFITMPGDLTRAGADLFTVRDNERGYLKLDRINTSIDNMSPGSRPLRVLETIPIEQDITAHSIIPVLPHDGPIEEANDGVVEFSSAHVDGVASELIVESGHSTQSNPHTINEVLRILRLNLSASDCATPSVPGMRLIAP